MNDLKLALWECTGLHSSAELPELLLSMRSFGLAAGLGAFTATDTPHPVDDLATDVNRRYTTASKAWNEPGPPPGEVAERMQWGWALVHLERPLTRANIIVTRRAEGPWDFLVSVPTFSHAVLDMTAEQFVEEWSARLERLGDFLYPRTRPALGYLTATGPGEYPAEQATIDRRELMLGWRSWFGPAYVQVFGRERLLGLPDETNTLDEDGVRHALAASASAVARSDGAVYRNVWRYVDQTGIQLAWPKKPRQAHRVSDEDAASALARWDIRTLLRRTYVLRNGVRKKFLHLQWVSYSGLERVVALETIVDLLEQELREHPDQAVALETTELPKDVREILDGLASRTGRLSYSVVDRSSGFEPATENLE